MSQANLRHVPSVEKVLAALGEQESLPRSMTTEVVRAEVAKVRERILAGGEAPSFEAILESLRETLAGLAHTRLQAVINGTGVIVHTNLGRAPLGADAADHLREIAAGYCNLEFDLDSGERGHRGLFLERALSLLCEAEASTVVNNCAAALVLVLRLFARHDRNEVIVSRGELVEIGGGFRIPEILATSGARLREVGTTNKTSLDDYQQAIAPGTALILKVHRSNFYLEGFTATPALAELVALARQHNVPIVEDLGSGAMIATGRLNPGLEAEPTPADSLRHGVDLVCFSGDKLFGGPQAGIIAGKAELVARLKREPLFRALRCDKLILAALEATAVKYLSAGAPADVPIIEMLAITEEELRHRAEKITARTKVATAIGRGTSRCGGGTMPRSEIASVTLDLGPAGLNVDDFAARLRRSQPPVVGYVCEGVLKIDLRTVFPWQDETLINVLNVVAKSL